MDSSKDLHTMVNKHKEKRKKIRTYGKSNKGLNDLVEKKFQKFVKHKKRRKTEKELQHFQEMQLSDNESKRVSAAWQKAWKVEKSHPLVPNGI